MNKRNISVSKGLENPLLFINSDMKKSICGISILLTVGLGFGNNVKIKECKIGGTHYVKKTS